MNNYNTFLYEVATDLYNRFGRENRLNSVTVVSPSKRSRLFLNRYFAELAGGKPLWSPRYLSILNLFEKASDLTLYDSQVQQIALVWELYCAYLDTLNAQTDDEFRAEPESFDEFYFFGEILLHDFNDIDRELAPAEKIYLNIADLKLLESWSFLTDAQREIISRFFNINPDSKLQANFYSIWKILGAVYSLFKQRLKEKQIAFEGMMMREVTETEKLSVITNDTEQTLVFVGFNHLSKVEQKLLDLMKNTALFYWNYDEYYLTTEAGKDISDYIKKYPDALQNTNHRHFEQKKQIEIVEAVNAVSQTGYIPQWLAGKTENQNFENADTAIVICDEKILPAVLSRIPSAIEPNIAILYSLMQSNIANLILALLEMQVKGVRKGGFAPRYQQPVMQLKNETDILSESDLFVPTKTPQDLLQYLILIVEKIGESATVENPMEIAALSETFKMLNSLENIVPLLESKETLLKLIRRLFLSIKISCAGEPAKGLQIMAMSDTRNMDFRNLLILSAGEGILPKIEPEASFIPPFLRRFYNLPTIENQDAQAACNFYRLLSRAENITLLYSTGKNATGKGEKSRYILQLQWESPQQNSITLQSLENTINSKNETPTISVEKKIEMLNLLKTKYNGETYIDEITKNSKQQALSPSAFNAYIDCPLKFYFRYVAGLKKPDNSDELSNAMLGLLFHRAMELIYQNLKNNKVDSQFFDKYLINKQITPFARNAVLKAFDEILFKTPTSIENYTGEQNIYFNVIARMVQNTLIFDLSQTPFEILDLEKWAAITINLNDETPICVGGVIDRIDRIDDTVRVVDYKTGKAPNENDFAPSIDAIFNNDRKKKACYQFQTFLYSSILRQQGYDNVAPALIFPLVADDEDYNPLLKELEGDFDAAFKNKLEELFDPQIPFMQCPKDEVCKFCDYGTICQRGSEE